MFTLTELITRVRTLLSDPTALRFSAEVLQEGARNALQALSDRLPRELELDLNAVQSGRIQPFSGLTSPLYLMRIGYPVAGGNINQLEPEVNFSYRMEDGQPVVHFLGSPVPQTGDLIHVIYAAPHTLSGLDAAAETTLPEGALAALVNGTAGHASLLRAHALLETSGGRPGEVDSLLKVAQIRLDIFEKNLADLRIFQEFGFPQGFALDQWDHREVF